MKYVKVEPVRDTWRGYSLNPAEYLKVLREIQAELPEGARAFALDGEHYNSFGSRCVKDLKLARISLTDESDRLSLELRFAPSEFKHDSWLIIGNVDVLEVSINVAAKRRRGDVWPESRRLGDLQLDEILPDEKGCSHEIQMTGGTIKIVAADLHAEWRDEARSD